MYNETREHRPLWTLLVALLPERESEGFYTLRDLTAITGTGRRALAHHARELWPDWEGHFRLTHAQASSLLRRVSYAGRKLPSRETLELRLQRLQK